MEKLSYRDYVLLGYSSPKALGKSIASPKLQPRDSDVDFSDVFGGPPRSSSTEMRHSPGETMDSFSSRGSEEMVAPLRNSWSALSEKPVFGVDSPNRRRHLGNDFFDDIFRGENSLSSTPRKPDKDPFSTMPASRTLSPARPLPPKFETFGGSSLPSHLSLSSKLATRVDDSTFSTSCRSPVANKDGSSNTFAFPSPRTGMTKVAIQPVLGEDDSRCDSRPSYRQSLLSHEFSIRGDEPAKSTKSAKKETGGQFAKDFGGSEVSCEGGQFHFSIYKWASKGVTLMMPSKDSKRSNSKEHGKNESIVTGLPKPVLQGVNLSSLDENMLPTSASFQFICDNHDNGSSLNLSVTMKDGIVEEPLPSEPERKPLSSFLNNTSEKTGKNNKLHSGVVGVSPSIDSCKLTDKKEWQPKLGDLDCQLNDSSAEPGKGTVKSAGGADCESKVNNPSAAIVDDNIKVKKRIGRKLIINQAEANVPTLEAVLINSEEKMHRRGTNGKVKEFIKRFNQEATPKEKLHADIQSSMRTDLGAFKIEESTSLSATNSDGKEKMSNGHSSGISSDAPVMVDKILKQTMTTDINNDSSSERNGFMESFTEPNPEDSEEAFGQIREIHGEDLHLNCLQKQSSEDQQKELQNGQNQDEIQMSDAKIQQWSLGKETNIRSLLSTLQYVLWSDSGWKPVALVDIIEGTSVKRVYQKALLCLHPDKLQQKGAAMHQKYIAEKVFDILQEAWDHFNSLSSV